MENDKSLDWGSLKRFMEAIVEGESDIKHTAGQWLEFIDHVQRAPMKNENSTPLSSPPGEVAPEWPMNDPAAMASIQRGMEQSQRGETVYRGSFAGEAGEVAEGVREAAGKELAEVVWMILQPLQYLGPFKGKKVNFEMSRLFAESWMDRARKARAALASSPHTPAGSQAQGGPARDAALSGKVSGFDAWWESIQGQMERHQVSRYEAARNGWMACIALAPEEPPAQAQGVAPAAPAPKGWGFIDAQAREVAKWFKKWDATEEVFPSEKLIDALHGLVEILEATPSQGVEGGRAEG